MTKKQYNRSKPDFIDLLPYDAFEFGNILGYNFDRYWVDLNKLRIIMKPKRGKQFKIVKPYYDKWNDTYYFNPTDTDGVSHHWRYYDFIRCFTNAYYLEQDYKNW